MSRSLTLTDIFRRIRPREVVKSAVSSKDGGCLDRGACRQESLTNKDACLAVRVFAYEYSSMIQRPSVPSPPLNGPRPPLAAAPPPPAPLPSALVPLPATPTEPRPPRP